MCPVGTIFCFVAMIDVPAVLGVVDVVSCTVLGVFDLHVFSRLCRQEFLKLLPRSSSLRIRHIFESFVGLLEFFFADWFVVDVILLLSQVRTKEAVLASDTVIKKC